MIEALLSIDLQLFGWLRGWHSPVTDRMMIATSAASGAGAIWLVLAGAAFLVPRHRAAAWRVVLTVGLAYLVVDGMLKPLVARDRPRGIQAVATDPPRALPPLPRTYSFPSGHAASTFGAALAVSRIWPQARGLWWTLAVLVGYSRIYLGHHFPLDVAAGALLGVALAWWVLGGREFSITESRDLGIS